MYRNKKLDIKTCYRNLILKTTVKHSFCNNFKENETLKPMYFVYDDLMLCKHCIFK